MEKQQEEIKRLTEEEYIKDYQLTRDEYCLLPHNLRMAYMQKLYGDLISSMHEGEIRAFRGYMQECYLEYFSVVGCKVTNYDFGIEEYEIEKVTSKCDYPFYESDHKLLEEYIEHIAKIRWKTFESAVRDKLLLELASLCKHSVDPEFRISDFEPMLRSDFLQTDIQDKLKDKVMRKQIKAIVVDDELSANGFLSPEYIDVLNNNGFEAIKDGKEIKIRRLN